MPGISEKEGNWEVSSTSNWGLITASIVEKLEELISIGGVVKQVQAATEEDLAAWAPKGFPAIAVVWKGSTIQKNVTLLAGRFALLTRGRWEIHHFCSTGRTDAAGLFSSERPVLRGVGIEREAARVRA